MGNLGTTFAQSIPKRREVNPDHAQTIEQVAAKRPGADRAFRVGGRYTKGTVRVDAGLILGMTASDPSFGFTTGLTWVFRGFTVP